MNNGIIMSVEQEIHRDVYSAQEALLEEAKRIINKPIIEDENKIAENLARIGFKNAKNIKSVEKKRKEREEQQKLKELIEYYNRTYPLNKFITEDMVETICNKYKIYLASSEDYIGEIPEKNQKEILNFRVKSKDLRETPFVTDEFGNTYFIGMGEDMIYKDFAIMAPENKLNMKGKIKHGHALITEDPIVLRAVKGGFLIVTSWGLEAGDELVVNKINN